MEKLSQWFENTVNELAIFSQTFVTQFHFLRPEWLLALLPMAVIIWKWRQRQTKQSGWNTLIDPAFHHLLLTDSLTHKKTSWPIWGMALIWLLTTLAVSGPTWQTVQTPTEKNRQGTVIVFDLSLSMLATDLKPNRLTRAQYKVRDLLNQHPELAMGMVAYAGSAHTIAPISQDNQSLLSLVPILTPTLMPVYGSNVLLAMQRANELLEGAKINKGHIIWVTDDLEKDQQIVLNAFLKSHDITLSILAVGTDNGGPIDVPDYGLLKDDSGNIILPKLPYNRLADLADENNAKISSITLDNSDIKRLLPPQQDKLMNKNSEINEEDAKLQVSWLEFGYSLTFALLLLGALAFRRGWLLTLSLLSVLPLGTLISLTPTASYAGEEEPDLKLSDVFTSPDRQGYLLWEQGDYARAETRFEDPSWRASTLYKLNKFSEAEALYAQDTSASGHYNRGNALAKQGKLEAAKKAYETAQGKHPSKAITDNLAIINKLLEKQQEQDKKKEEQKKKDEQKQENKDEKSNEKQQKPAKPSDKGPEDKDRKDDAQTKEKPEEKSEDKGKPDDSQAGKQPKEHAAKPEDEQTKPEATGKTKDSDDQQSDLDAEKKLRAQRAEVKKNQTKQEQEQAKKTWLNQIPDEPGVFLKRKFDYQYRRSQNNNDPSSSQKMW